jgi:hypothetical protein
VVKDPELFQAMYERSARFRRALQMVAATVDHTDIDILRGYVSMPNPAMWLEGAGRTRSARASKGVARIGPAN